MLKHSFFACVLISFLLVPLPALADSARKLVDQGNRLFAAGKYDDALASYEEAAVDKPESAPIYFNKGTAYYRKEDYTSAARAFEQAALKSRDLQLEAQSKFNLGLCSFREAQRRQDSELDKALESCGKSIRCFQEALELEPGFTQAAENIEVVRLTMKSILDQIQKQKQEAQKQQAARQKAADQIKKLIENQQELLNRGTAIAEDLHRQTGTPDVKNKTAGLAAAQEQLRQETLKTATSLPPVRPASGAPQAAPDAAKQHLETSAAEQSAAVENLQGGRVDPARDNQQQSLDALQQALDSLNGNNQNKQCKMPPQGGGEEKKNKQQQQQQSGRKDTPKTEGQKNENRKEQLAQLPDDAQKILDEEQKNNSMRQLHGAGGFSEVDKDW